MLNFVSSSTPAICELERGTHQTVSGTGSRWPQVNHAIGATSSMYHASCVTADAADADLIVVELTLNDYPGPEMDITKSPSKCAGRIVSSVGRWTLAQLPPEAETHRARSCH